MLSSAVGRQINAGWRLSCVDLLLLFTDSVFLSLLLLSRAFLQLTSVIPNHYNCDVLNVTLTPSEHLTTLLSKIIFPSLNYTYLSSVSPYFLHEIVHTGFFCRESL